jgi:tyrosine-protein phosphatase non-receptor type 23
VIYTGVQEIAQGRGIVAIGDVVRTLRQRRKHMLQEKEQLKFCYHAILYHAQDLLLKRKW